jgi:hypothetical protein
MLSKSVRLTICLTCLLIHAMLLKTDVPVVEGKQRRVPWSSRRRGRCCGSMNLVDSLSESAIDSIQGSAFKVARDVVLSTQLLAHGSGVTTAAGARISCLGLDKPSGLGPAGPKPFGPVGCLGNPIGSERWSYFAARVGLGCEGPEQQADRVVDFSWCTAGESAAKSPVPEHLIRDKPSKSARLMIYLTYLMTCF